MFSVIFASVLLLSQLSEIHGQFDITVSPGQISCEFGISGDTNWYCQDTEKFIILVDPAERGNRPLWTPFLTQAGRLVSRPTGPDIGIVSGNSFLTNYLTYNSAVTDISQGTYSTPVLKVSGNIVCLSFNYSMFGAEMGSVYMTADFNNFDTFKKIDVANPKTVVSNGRIETLLAQGDQGNIWKYAQHSIALNGRTQVQVGIQIIRGSGVLSDVAIDNVYVHNSDSSCPGTGTGGGNAVNGNWGQWTATTTCSKTCGSGVQTVRRECNNPAPSNGGLSCLMLNGIRGSTEINTNSACNTQACSGEMFILIKVVFFGLYPLDLIKCLPDLKNLNYT